jgi:hypothetical protein
VGFIWAELKLFRPTVEANSELVEQTELSREAVWTGAARKRYPCAIADRADSELNLVEEYVLIVAGGPSDDGVPSGLQSNPEIVGQLCVKDGDVRPGID